MKKIFFVFVISLLGVFLLSCVTEQYKIVFNTNGGNSIADVFADEIETLPTPTKEGFAFVGWYTDEALEKAYNGEEITTDIVLYAKWIKEYTISYNLDGGTCLNLVEKFTIDQQVDLPSPIKDGHVFDGWYEENNKITSIENKDYNLVAKWLKIHTISYDLDGGECVRLIESYKDGESVTLPTPTKEGFEFVGWYEGETKVESITNGSKDYSLKARWDSLYVDVDIYNKENNEKLITIKTLKGEDVDFISLFLDGYELISCDENYRNVTEDLVLNCEVKKIENGFLFDCTEEKIIVHLINPNLSGFYFTVAVDKEGLTVEGIDNLSSYIDKNEVRIIYSSDVNITENIIICEIIGNSINIMGFRNGVEVYCFDDENNILKTETYALYVFE